MDDAGCQNQAIPGTDILNQLNIFQTAVNRSSVATAVTDSKGLHIWQNFAFTDLFGYPQVELDSHTHEKLFTDPKEYLVMQSVLDSKGPISRLLDAKKKNGRSIDVELTIEPVRDDSGHIFCYLWIYEDVTEQKKTRKELAFQREYLATLHTISLGMFRRLKLKDLLKAIMLRASKLTRIPNGFLYQYNTENQSIEARAACGLFEKYAGLTVTPGEGLIGRVFETGDPVIAKEYQKWPDKETDGVFAHISAIICIPLISGAKIRGVIGLFHDTKGLTIDQDCISAVEEFSAIAQIAIDNARLFEKHKKEFEKRLVVESERKEMESKLYQAQRLESIGTLAGGIAHDFNNILTSIMGFTQIAMGGVEKQSQIVTDLNEIYKASLRAKDLVQQILTFARQSDGNLNAVKVSIIAKEVLKFVRASIPVTINIRQEIVTDAKVIANPTQLYQIFLNLYTNAAQAMEKDGGELRVDMTCEKLEKGPGHLPAGEYIRISISDTGIGIPDDVITKIFEPYFTTKQVGEGTGLGLSVAYGAVKAMKGDIRVDSAPGRGTTFTILLPTSGEPEKEYLLEDVPVTLGNREMILFVDDEPTVAKVAERMLVLLNYRVTALTDSLQALELFRSKPDSFKAVVTDWTMPNLTGDKLALEVKKINPDVPVILCTGLQKTISAKDMRRYGLDLLCKKPFTKNDLASALDHVLKKEPPESDDPSS